jgi:predicted aspartyl protease
VGLTYVDIDVANVAAPERVERIRLMVDSGAAHTIVPTAVLHKLGIEPHSRQVYQLANGLTMARQKGTALFRYGERVGGADVVFGEPGDARLLGVLTLEALGLGLNPLRRELIELPMMMA